MEVVDIIRGVELQQQEQQQQQQEEEEEQHFQVLAVDDSIIDRKLLERLLRSSSYKVTCVDSGDKALKYLGLIDDLDLDLDNHSSSQTSIQSSSPPQPFHQEGIKVNLIMTDYCMPGMSGYDLLKRVKGSSWKDVPVVVMSSENVPSRINMCLEGGADEFLLKPLQLADMEKLQPYLLKSSSSLDINSCDDANSSTDSDTENLISNNNNSSSTISKRKAMSAEPPERSRPKMKGLAVV